MALGEFTRLLIDGRKATVDVVECICYLPLSPVLRRFNNKKQELSDAGVDTTEYWVFHGTDNESIAGIVCNGFKVGGRDPGVPAAHGNFHGNGVYTAEGPNTPMMYASNNRKVKLITSFMVRHYWLDGVTRLPLRTAIFISQNRIKQRRMSILSTWLVANFLLPCC